MDRNDIYIHKQMECHRTLNVRKHPLLIHFVHLWEFIVFSLTVLIRNCDILWNVVDLLENYVDKQTINANNLKCSVKLRKDEEKEQERIRLQL